MGYVILNVLYHVSLLGIEKGREGMKSGDRVILNVALVYFHNF